MAVKLPRNTHAFSDFSQPDYCYLECIYGTT